MRASACLPLSHPPPHSSRALLRAKPPTTRALSCAALDYHWHPLERSAFTVPAAELERDPELARTTTLYFDGACPVCSREVAQYRRLAPPGSPLRFVDISALGDGDDGGAAGALGRAFGVTPDEALARAHVIENGELRTGIAAFVALWRWLPTFRYLAMVMRLPFAVEAAELLYGVWARMRPRLVKSATQRVGPGGSCRIEQPAETGS